MQAETTVEAPARHQAQEWLDVLTEHVLEHGLDDVSLRGMAGLVGTSHRLLSYYFGSLDGVLAAIANELRRRRSEALAATATSRRELFERAWETTGDRDVRVITQIYFRLAARGVVPAEPEGAFQPVVGDWTEPLVQAGLAEGLPLERARVEAQLLSAAGHGLLLRELSGVPRQECEQALQYLIDLTCGPRRD